jgi:hypothetical protein
VGAAYQRPKAAPQPTSSCAETSAPTSQAVEPTTDIGPKATGPPAYISATASTSPPAPAVAAVAVTRSGHAAIRRPITAAAPAPAAAGTRNSSSQALAGCCEPGVAASSGSPGSGPRTTDSSDTFVPVPRAKPGPANTAITHSAAFGTSERSTRNSPASPAAPPPICRCVM